MSLGKEDGSAKRWCYERGSLWSIDLTGSISSQTEAVPPWHLSEATSALAPVLAATMGLSTVGEVEKRFDRGARCFAAWSNSDLVSYGWVSPGSECIGELEREIHLAPDEGYIWDCLTLPAYRGRGLYTTILRLIVNALSEQGFRRIWIGSAVSNRPSIRGFVAAGFRPVLRVVYLRVGGFSFLYSRRFRGAQAEVAEMARRALAAPGERRWGAFLVRRVHYSRLEPCPGVGS
jgi:ribosomal protein S18 acetylase RimI-like enzyme